MAYFLLLGDDVEPKDPGDFEETGDWEKNDADNAAQQNSWS